MIVVCRGDKYGRLTIIEEVAPIQNDGREYHAFLCRCDCGRSIVVRLTSLRSGNTRSCGCRRKEVSTALALAGTGTKRKQYIKKNLTYWNHWRTST